MAIWSFEGGPLDGISVSLGSDTLFVSHMTVTVSIKPQVEGEHMFTDIEHTYACVSSSGGPNKCECHCMVHTEAKRIDYEYDWRKDWDDRKDL